MVEPRWLKKAKEDSDVRLLRAEGWHGAAPERILARLEARYGRLRRARGLGLDLAEAPGTRGSVYSWPHYTTFIAFLPKLHYIYNVFTEITLHL